MTAAAKTILYFSYYLFFMGLSLAIIPNLILPLLGFQETQEVWVRVLGIVTLVVGYYYFQTANAEITLFFGFTVIARIFVFIAFILMVIFGKAPVLLILTGFVDFAGAIWTHMSLKKK